MAAENGDEVTVWIGRLAQGDPQAAQVIWRQYFGKLVRFARRKLEDMPRRAFDEEDVAISAMHSFCRGLEVGQFPKVEDREDLWKLLVTITARKAYAQRRSNLRAKRGGGQVRGESVFLRPGAEDEQLQGIAAILGDEPTPEFAAMVVENTERLLASVGDETLRTIALLKLEGYTNDQIADQLGCVRRTIERKLERIRERWSEEGLTS